MDEIVRRMQSPSKKAAIVGLRSLPMWVGVAECRGAAREGYRVSGANKKVCVGLPEWTIKRAFRPAMRARRSKGRFPWYPNFRDSPLPIDFGSPLSRCSRGSVSVTAIYHQSSLDDYPLTSSTLRTWERRRGGGGAGGVRPPTSPPE